MQRLGRHLMRPWMLAGDHFVKNNSECEKVAARIQFLAKNLFRRHVGNGSDNPSGNRASRRNRVIRLPRSAQAANPLREPKVQYLHIAVETDHDVGGFEIAVDDARSVCCVERLENLPRGLDSTG